MLMYCVLSLVTENDCVRRIVGSGELRAALSAGVVLLNRENSSCSVTLQEFYVRPISTA